MKNFGLSKNERIKSKRLFDILYSNGKTIYSKNGLFKAVFYLSQDVNTTGVKVAFAVYKKAGKAVWRNRVKRLMRESYRLNKHILTENIKEGTLLISFSPNKVNSKNYKKIFLNDVQPEIVYLMQKIAEILSVSPSLQNNNFKKSSE